MSDINNGIPSGNADNPPSALDAANGTSASTKCIDKASDVSESVDGGNTDPVVLNGVAEAEKLTIETVSDVGSREPTVNGTAGMEETGNADDTLAERHQDSDAGLLSSNVVVEPEDQTDVSHQAALDSSLGEENGRHVQDPLRESNRNNTSEDQENAGIDVSETSGPTTHVPRQENRVDRSADYYEANNPTSTRSTSSKRPRKSDRLLIDIPKPKTKRYENGCSSSGLLADSAYFTIDDEPGPSNRPYRRLPRSPSFSPPANRPSRPSYIDEDYEFAKMLQEEENRKSYNYNYVPSTSFQSTSSHIFPQQPLSPKYSEVVEIVEIEDDPALVDKAHRLYRLCQKKFPMESYPQPFKVAGFDAEQLCNGYRQVLRGKCFPYEGHVPPVPPGSPKAPEQAFVPSVTAPFRIVVNADQQDLPEIEKNKPSAFQKLVFSANTRIKNIPKLFDTPSMPTSSSCAPQTEDYFDDSQPGPSNRRPISQQIYEDEEEDLRLALELSRQEHQEFLRRQNGIRDDPGASTSDDSCFRSPAAPRKRRMVPLGEHESSPPPARRSAHQPSFFAVETIYDMDEPEISSTSSSSEASWPLIQWLDPENMPPLASIDKTERRKMPLSYQMMIDSERVARIHREEVPQSPKHPIQLAIEREEEAEKNVLEKSFIKYARSNITSPNIVPNVVSNTRFEVHIRFPFFPRPSYVRDVLAALHISGNESDLENIVMMPREIRQMSVGEFFKHAVYTMLGLKLDGSLANQSLSDPHLELAKHLYFDSVAARLHEAASKIGEDEERKFAKSMAVSYHHALGRQDVNRDDIREMQHNFVKKEKKIAVPRTITQEDLDVAFKKPACIQKEEELLLQIESEKMAVQTDENNVPITGETEDVAATLENKIEAAEMVSQEPTSSDAMVEKTDN
uniref:BTB domain-containing protein n=1 Tax=Caenorhabditis tropicalis TaxID=1561998 RepID=A0A1I7TNE3_9PELO